MTPQGTLPSTHVLVFTTDLTDEELRGKMRDLGLALRATGTAFMATIMGYEHDSRELQEIPEVIAFCKRLVNLGLISVMEMTTLSEEARQRNPLAKSAWGALEVWMTANNLLKKGQTVVTQQMLDRFAADLMESNRRFALTTGVTLK